MLPSVRSLRLASLIFVSVVLLSCGSAHDSDEYFVFVSANLQVPYWKAAGNGFSHAVFTVANLGPIKTALRVSTSGTDADWIVKVIDVYPGDFPNPEPNPANAGVYDELFGQYVELYRRLNAS